MYLSYLLFCLIFVLCSLFSKFCQDNKLGILKGAKKCRYAQNKFFPNWPLLVREHTFFYPSCTFKKLVGLIGSWDDIYQFEFSRSNVWRIVAAVSKMATRLYRLEMRTSVVKLLIILPWPIVLLHADCFLLKARNILLQ